MSTAVGLATASLACLVLKMYHILFDIKHFFVQYYKLLQKLFIKILDPKELRRHTLRRKIQRKNIFCLGKPSKITVKVGKWSKPCLTPSPTLPGLVSLTVIFFIVYLPLIDHEMYFEQNLYFSLTKVVWHLENFAFFLMFIL